jgi:hypothetical protein
METFFGDEFSLVLDEGIDYEEFEEFLKKAHCFDESQKCYYPQEEDRALNRVGYQRSYLLLCPWIYKVNNEKQYYVSNWSSLHYEPYD